MPSSFDNSYSVDLWQIMRTHTHDGITSPILPNLTNVISDVATLKTQMSTHTHNGSGSALLPAASRTGFIETYGTSGSVSTLTITLSGGQSNFSIFFRYIKATGGSANVFMTFNNDSASNYFFTGIQVNAAGTLSIANAPTSGNAAFFLPSMDSAVYSTAMVKVLGAQGNVNTPVSLVDISGQWLSTAGATSQVFYNTNGYYSGTNNISAITIYSGSNFGSVEAYIIT